MVEEKINRLRSQEGTNSKSEYEKGNKGGNKKKKGKKASLGKFKGEGENNLEENIVRPKKRQ